MKKKIGLVGFGSIGKRHANNLVALGHDVYVYDPAYLDAPFDGHGSIKPMAAALDGIDGYVIASPTMEHFADIETYSETGKPLFVEKPIIGDQSGHLDASNVIMVGYNLRYHACIETAHEWLTDKEIGNILWANITVGQFNDKPIYRRDGVILNWSHEIDLALHLLGPAEVITSSTKLEDGQDVLCDICLRHSSGGAHSLVHLDYLTRPEIRQTIIVGTDGQIIIDLVSRNAWLRDTNNNIRDHIAAHDTFEMNYREEMSDFIDLISNDSHLDRQCTAVEALEVVKICATVRQQAGL